MLPSLRLLAVGVGSVVVPSTIGHASFGRTVLWSKVLASTFEITTHTMQKDSRERNLFTKAPCRKSHLAK